LQRTGQQGFGRVEHFIDQAMAQRLGCAHFAAGTGQLFHHCQRQQLG
jgi:hypothetical protein